MCVSYNAANRPIGDELRVKRIASLTNIVVGLASDRCAIIDNEHFVLMITRKLPGWAKLMNDVYNGCYDATDLKLLRIYHQSVKDISTNASSCGRVGFGKEFVESVTIIRTVG